MNEGDYSGHPELELEAVADVGEHAHEGPDDGLDRLVAEVLTHLGSDRIAVHDPITPEPAALLQDRHDVLVDPGNTRPVGQNTFPGSRCQQRAQCSPVDRAGRVGIGNQVELPRIHLEQQADDLLRTGGVDVEPIVTARAR